MKHQKHQVKWQDMNNGQRVSVVLVGIIQIALLAAAMRDIRQRNTEELRGSKMMWRAISFVNFIGPISYFALGRKPKEELSLMDDE